jgi:GNAT superfamily N-acetyltransferase
MKICGEYEIDSDRERVDRDVVWNFLSTSAYWGRWRTRADLENQMDAAWRVVGAYAVDGTPVGCARATSDGCASAYLADVFILEAHRGQGLGQALLREMIDDGPGVAFRWMLHTGDAHRLYAKFGFAEPDTTYMERPAAPR